MKSIKIPFNKVSQLSSKDIAYATGDSRLIPFYNLAFDLSSFEGAIKEREKFPVDRHLLVSTLQKQGQYLELSELTKENIISLADDKTFTIVTAHQPSLFTGPLYYIYKIISTINLCKKLSKEYSTYRFVPVFISGAEDHDFEEVNSTRLFNKVIEWETSQTGAVGLMSLENFDRVLADLKDILGDKEEAIHLYSIIEDCFKGVDTYGKGAIRLVNYLFKDHGLVVLDMNQAEFKKCFLPVLKKEIYEQPSKKLVEEVQSELNDLGFSSQAFVRPINVFYMFDGIRARIERNIEGNFEIVGTTHQFTPEEMEAELNNYPERFSPNVVLRPIYQESILPNLAYVGGGGEIAYWLERKKQFDHFKTFFPILVRRNSVLLMDENSAVKFQKMGFATSEIFEDLHQLQKKYIEANSSVEVNIDSEKEMVKAAFQSITQKAKEIDPTLEKKFLAEEAKNLKALDQLGDRLVRAEKQKHEVSLNQLQKLTSRFFPNGGLQERVENFIPFYLKYGDEFFEILLKELNPLEEGFVVIEA
jgi:bacillithiol biosynthesis cysteine-adding enzyme BshC